MYAAYGMFLSFFGIAGVYVLLGAELIALFHLIIYVGGILILLLFGIMLTKEMKQISDRKNKREIVVGSIVTGFLTGIMLVIVTATEWNTRETGSLQFANEKDILYQYGQSMFHEHLLTFLLMGIFLLVVLIGAASLARKEA